MARGVRRNISPIHPEYLSFPARCIRIAPQRLLSIFDKTTLESPTAGFYIHHACSYRARQHMNEKAETAIRWKTTKAENKYKTVANPAFFCDINTRNQARLFGSISQIFREVFPNHAFRMKRPIQPVAVVDRFCQLGESLHQFHCKEISEGQLLFTTGENQ